jgi:hypothetical protein
MRHPGRYWTGFGLIACRITKNSRRIRKTSLIQDQTSQTDRANHVDHLASDKHYYQMIIRGVSMGGWWGLAGGEFHQLPLATLVNWSDKDAC